jgi:hypothetical protein
MKEPYSDLKDVTDRKILETNYWRLQRIERKLRGIEVIFAVVASTALGLALILALLEWLY